MKPLFAFLSALALFAACADDDSLSGRPVAGLWGEEKSTLELSFAETVCDPVTGTCIRFRDVNDSRCPKGMYCITPGEVRVTLDIVHNEAVLSSFTIACGEEIESFVNQESYVFALKTATPDTRTDDLKKTAYAITLEVEPE